MPSEAEIQTKVDEALTKYNSGPINYFEVIPGVEDIYGQSTPTYEAAVPLVGRSILKPTPEKVTVIGNGEMFDLAFLFSRLEMLRKFPSLDEGRWIDIRGEMTWDNRRTRIEAVRPSGQVEASFSLIIILASSIEGARV